MTCASGIEAPVLSRTTPRSEPVVLCARALMTLSSDRKRLIRTFDPTLNTSLMRDSFMITRVDRVRMLGPKAGRTRSGAPGGTGDGELFSVLPHRDFGDFERTKGGFKNGDVQQSKGAVGSFGNLSFGNLSLRV